MRAYDIIRKKRDGEELSKEEIGFFINGVVRDEIPNYQASAFLMAVCLKGMTDAETIALTEAMLRSGTVLDLGSVSGVKVDKHSTGGVGDKTSIIVAPLMAAMGIKVPMVSGRALGHTGGTLDKLESIPGFRTGLSVEEFKRNVSELGASIMGQTDDLAPADRELYALRDVTATVESVPLIASSIMSKKLAEGVDGLVLDVKTGSGAFMAGMDEARALARTLVNIGNAMGVRTVALITDMDQPLGKTVGNSLEIKECVAALRGKGPRDLMEVTLTLSAWMLSLADSLTEDVPLARMTGETLKRYKDEMMDFIEKGDAFKKFVELVDAQGGDPEVAFKPALLPGADYIKEIRADRDGYVTRLDARAVGTASMLLGAGRTRAEDEVDPAAGIILVKKVGDRVKQGEPVAMLHTNDEGLFYDAEEEFLAGFEIGEREKAKKKLIREIVMP
ncbi:MAG: pyrimidine-nucleoside phosphorylase [Thermodesulfovibrionales bacterium]